MKRLGHLICLGVASATIAMAAASSHWAKVPAKDHARTNPYAGQPDAIRVGARIYHDHCAECHREDALGDGRKKPALRGDAIRQATDGDLEWFLRQGDLRHGMPSWSNMPDAQRWQLIAYLRSLQ